MIRQIALDTGIVSTDCWAPRRVGLGGRDSSCRAFQPSARREIRRPWQPLRGLLHQQRNPQDCRGHGRSEHLRGQGRRVRELDLTTGIVSTLVGVSARAGVLPGPLPGGLNHPKGSASPRAAIWSSPTPRRTRYSSCGRLISGAYYARLMSSLRANFWSILATSRRLLLCRGRELRRPNLRHPADARPQPSETIAIIRVNGGSASQVVTLDGEPVGSGVGKGTRLHIEVMPGVHEVGVVAPDSGMRPVGVRFVAEAGRVYRAETPTASQPNGMLPDPGLAPVCLRGRSRKRRSTAGGASAGQRGAGSGRGSATGDPFHAPRSGRGGRAARHPRRVTQNRFTPARSRRLPTRICACKAEHSPTKKAG